MMQKSCFLFGHADTPQSILPELEHAIEKEIENGISVFYVGYHGSFDRIAKSALRNQKRKHNNIILILLLAYHPSEQPIELPLDFDETFYPPLESVPRRYAIVRANQYMIKMADSFICYVTHYGNTYKLLNEAQKQEKTRNVSIRNIAENK